MSTTQPIPAVLCENCPWRKSSPKAGEAGGSVPALPTGEVVALAKRMRDSFAVMQCHKSSPKKPRPCAGYLSVVGYEHVGVRFAAMTGAIRPEDVGRPLPGLYGSMREMLREADQIEAGEDI